MSIKRNIVIEKGTTFELQFNLTDDSGDVMALSGYTPAATLKRWYTSSSSHSFTAATDVTAGTVTLSLTPAQSNAIWPGSYVYDVILTDGDGNVTRVVEGRATVTPNVSGS